MRETGMVGLNGVNVSIEGTHFKCHSISFNRRSEECGGESVKMASITLDSIIPESIPTGTGLKLKFRCGDVDHPILGKSSELEAEFPLILSKGSE